MNDQKQENEDYMSNTRGLLAGLLIGGLLGAVAMLLLAPQSGKRTRARILRQGIELREQASETIEDAVAQAQVKAHQITADVRGQAAELQQRGQGLLDEQKERFFTAVDAGKKAVRSSIG